MPREPNSWANLTNDTGRNVEQKDRRNIVHSTAYLQTDVNIHFISHVRWSTVQSVDKTRIQIVVYKFCLLLECHMDIVFVLLWFALEEFKPDPRIVWFTRLHWTLNTGQIDNRVYLGLVLDQFWTSIQHLKIVTICPSLDVSMVFNIWTLHWVIYLDVMWKSWMTEATETAWRSVYNESKFASEKTTSPAVTKQLLDQTSMSKNALKKTSLCTGFSLSGEHEKVIVPIQAGA